MKQVGRTKRIEVRYKGWTLVQVPWNAYGTKQYAKWLFDPEGKERLHSGYSKYCSRKELRLMIRSDVDRLLPMLEEKMDELRCELLEERI